uniref:RING-type domain-containing protein n=1 Tax=viral metagenome TaxID=1070528 RepID=A0A6C0DV26_9ZZZZ
MENNFTEFNSIIRLLMQDIITNDVYLPVTTSSPSQRALQSSLYDRNPIRHVITEQVKNTLIPIKFREANDIENNLKCAILCETFKDDDDIIQLPCNHCFFVEPIMKWLTNDSCECPVCRYKFDSMEKNTREEKEEEEEVIEHIEENIEDIEEIEEDIEEDIEENIEDFEEFYNDFAYEQLNIGNFLNFINNSYNIYNSETISNNNIYPTILNQINLNIIEDSSYNELD